VPPVCSTEIEKKAEILSPPGAGTAAGRAAAVARASRGSPTRHFALGTPRPWSKQLFGHWELTTAFSTRISQIYPARPAAGTKRGRKEEGRKEYQESPGRSRLLPDSSSFLPFSFLSSSVQELFFIRGSDKCERGAAIMSLRAERGNRWELTTALSTRISRIDADFQLRTSNWEPRTANRELLFNHRGHGDHRERRVPTRISRIPNNLRATSHEARAMASNRRGPPLASGATAGRVGCNAWSGRARF